MAGGLLRLLLDEQQCRDCHSAPQAATFQPISATDGRLDDDAVGRVASENALFKHALGSLGEFYSHPKALIFMLTASPPDDYDEERYDRSGNVETYFNRGLCFCESSWAGMVKPSYLLMDLGVDLVNEGRLGWYGWWKKSSQGRGAPLMPGWFEEQLKTTARRIGPSWQSCTARASRTASGRRPCSCTDNSARAMCRRQRWRRCSARAMLRS